MQDKGKRTQPLDGLRVLDFTHLIAGPLCTMLLADAGAEVIKVEPPYGDRARFRGAEHQRADGSVLSAYHAAYNRGKKSIVIDLKRPESQSVVRRILAKCDVLVENFSPGVMDRLGLSLRELRCAHPTLITASIGVFSQDISGSAAVNDRDGRRGLALIAEAESGIMSVRTDLPPSDLGFQLGDQATGLFAYSAILTALYRRQARGCGSHVSISMIDSLVALNSSAFANFSIGGEEAVETPNAVYDYFETTDGFVAIGLSTDEQWSRFVAALDASDLRDASNLSSYHLRNEHRDFIRNRVSLWTQRRSCDEVIHTLEDARIPCGKRRSVPEIATSSLGAEFLEVSDSYGTRVRVPRNPMGFVPKDPRIPELGEHTNEILGRLVGYSDAQVDALLNRSVAIQRGSGTV